MKSIARTQLLLALCLLTTGAIGQQAEGNVPGYQPYTPTRIEWLALVCNSALRNALLICVVASTGMGCSSKSTDTTATDGGADNTKPTKVLKFPQWRFSIEIPKTWLVEEVHHERSLVVLRMRPPVPSEERGVSLIVAPAPKEASRTRLNTSCKETRINDFEATICKSTISTATDVTIAAPSNQIFTFEGNSFSALGKLEPTYAAIVWSFHFYP